MFEIGTEFSLEPGQEISCTTQWGMLTLKFSGMSDDIAFISARIQNRDPEIKDCPHELRPRRGGTSVLLTSFFTEKQGWPRLCLLPDNEDGKHNFIMLPSTG